MKIAFCDPTPRYGIPVGSSDLRLVNIMYQVKTVQVKLLSLVIEKNATKIAELFILSCMNIHILSSVVKN